MLRASIPLANKYAAVPLKNQYIKDFIPVRTMVHVFIDYDVQQFFLPQNWRLNGVTSWPLALRQRMKAATFCLNVLGFVSPPIRQALPIDAFQHLLGAHRIVKAKGGTGVGAEIELRKIAVQMLFPAMLVGADHAALEH